MLYPYVMHVFMLYSSYITSFPFISAFGSHQSIHVYNKSWPLLACLKKLSIPIPYLIGFNLHKFWWFNLHEFDQFFF